MPTVPDDAKQFINRGFVRRLEAVDPPQVDVIVETRRGDTDDVLDALRDRTDVRFSSIGTIDGKYIPITVPQESIPDVARLDGVVLVHQDQKAGVMFAPEVLRDAPFLTAENDPIRTALSDRLYDAFAPQDPFVGSIRIGEVEVPRFNFAQIPPGDPVETLFTAGDELTGGNLSGEEIVPTTESVSWVRDGNVTDGAIRSDTKVAIIDTGHTPTEPENGGRVPRLESYVPGEPPVDMMGHGSWVTNMVTANPAPGAWGTVSGIAPGSVYGHFKALNTFPGFGKTSWIMKAMNRALEWGADVINMSLGGTQQGPVTDDPYARFINEHCKENAGDEQGAIFVVASGNAGPGRWTIGSPGIAPKALTVGSWSLLDDAPAVFSSRGPQGSWYQDNRNELTSDINRFGAFEMVKPDVAAPGGGRENSDLAGSKDELLFQASTGWYDGLRDGLKDNRSNMKGTSMATPAAAGLVKRLYDAGIIQTAAEVKQVVSERESVRELPNAATGANESRQGKNIAYGFGPLHESLYAPGQ